ncbi:MAG: hypothetical protein JNN30_01670 [Rhodanobacteraceae bacterium]|nr:hypothetical protein [Rhodanobacteraceae bacterium]
MYALKRRRNARLRLLAALLPCLLTTAIAAQERIEAANGAAVGPLAHTPHGGDWFALLDLDDAGPIYSDRLFTAHYEAPATSGFVEILVNRDGIAHPYAPYVLHAAPACEGQAYVSTAAMKPARSLRAAIVGARADLYLATSEVATLQVMASLRSADGCRPFTYAIRAYPVRPAGALLDRLPPPYRVGGS